MELELAYHLTKEQELACLVESMELELAYRPTMELGLASVEEMDKECHHHRFQRKELELACQSMGSKGQGSNPLELELAYHPTMELG
jgi:hypothetical protein